MLPASTQQRLADGVGERERVELVDGMTIEWRRLRSCDQGPGAGTTVVHRHRRGSSLGWTATSSIAVWDRSRGVSTSPTSPPTVAHKHDRFSEPLDAARQPVSLSARVEVDLLTVRADLDGHRQSETR
jgi:hypothetical protein